MAKKRIIIPAAIIVIAVGVLIYCLISLFSYNNELDDGDNSYEEIAQRYVLSDYDDKNGGESVTGDGNGGKSDNNNAQNGDDHGENLPKVDDKTLRGEIPDYVGWIYSENTPINYPIVKAQDNDYYLRRLPDGRKNISGSIFMDFRCSADFSDFNTIIYGHSFRNSTRLFGSLAKYSGDVNYYDSHRVIYIMQGESVYAGHVFAGFDIMPDGFVYSIPANDAEREEYLARVRESSDFESEIETKITDKIVVLSTCSYRVKDARYVLFLKLEEKH